MVVLIPGNLDLPSYQTISASEVSWKIRYFEVRCSMEFVLFETYQVYKWPPPEKQEVASYINSNQLYPLQTATVFFEKNGTFLIFSRQVSLPFRASHDSIPPSQVQYIQWPDFLAAMEWRRCARGCHRNGSHWWRSAQKCHGNVLQWPDPDRGRVAHVWGWTPTCGGKFWLAMWSLKKKRHVFCFKWLCIHKFRSKKQVATLLLKCVQIMNGITTRGAHQVENFDKVIDAYYLTGWSKSSHWEVWYYRNLISAFVATKLYPEILIK